MMFEQNFMPEGAEINPDTPRKKGLARLFEILSRDLDGSFNEDYCKWCYTGGKFTYDSMEQLLEFLITHMSNEQFPPEQARTYFNQMLPKLKHWSK